MRSISTATIKMYGEMTSPWGTPCSKSIFLDKWPPSSIYASRQSKKIEIHLTMSDLNPSSFKTVVMKLKDFAELGFPSDKVYSF